jgi:3-deoxy-D-manno-octulosonic-acid transferase
VKDGIELGEVVVKLFGDSARRSAMGEAAAAAVARERGAVERTMTIVESVAGIA